MTVRRSRRGKRTNKDVAYGLKYGKTRHDRAIRMYDEDTDHSIESTKTLRSGKTVYTVRSQRVPRQLYTVDPNEPRCTCPDFKYRKVEACKHILLVEMYIRSKRRALRGRRIQM
jgi:hypothetical protein